MLDYLILVTQYPSETSSSMQYVHTRALSYKASGLRGAVYCCSERGERIFEGIEVYGKSMPVPAAKCLIVHAPNIRQHYFFIKRYGEKFPHLVLFFHGHEALNINQEYPAPYEYVAKRGPLRVHIQDLYDSLKFKLLRNLVNQNKEKISLVYVSEWMKKKVHANLHLNNAEVREYIIPNSIHPIFESFHFKAPVHAEYDFFTARGSIDNAKYGIDIIRDMAIKNPSQRFLLVGSGYYFNHYSKPDNLDYENRTLKPQEIPTYMERASCALLPTRLDAQGVLACEIASTGMPLITSDIDICKMVFSNFNNVAYIIHESKPGELEDVKNKLLSKGPFKKNNFYYHKNTTEKEAELIQMLGV